MAANRRILKALPIELPQSDFLSSQCIINLKNTQNPPSSEVALWLPKIAENVRGFNSLQNMLDTRRALVLFPSTFGGLSKNVKNDELEIQQHGFYPSVPIWTPAALQCSSSSSDDDDDDDDDDVFDDSFNRVGILTRERKKRDLLFVHHHQRRMTSNVDFCWRKKPTVGDVCLAIESYSNTWTCNTASDVGAWIRILADKICLNAKKSAAVCCIKSPLFTQQRCWCQCRDC